MLKRLLLDWICIFAIIFPFLYRPRSIAKREIMHLVASVRYFTSLLPQLLDQWIKNISVSKINPMGSGRPPWAAGECLMVYPGQIIDHCFTKYSFHTHMKITLSVPRPSHWFLSSNDISIMNKCLDFNSDVYSDSSGWIHSCENLEALKWQKMKMPFSKMLNCDILN